VTPAELDDAIAAWELDRKVAEYRQSRRREVLFNAWYAQALVDEVTGRSRREIEHSASLGAVKRVSW
jgi:hypothetical protein